jgi:hypothetical protein
MADHIYHIPSLAKRLRVLEPGTGGTHKTEPSMPLTVVSGPKQGIRGNVYRVRRPDGRVDPVLEINLII